MQWNYKIKCTQSEKCSQTRECRFSFVSLLAQTPPIPDSHLGSGENASGRQQLVWNCILTIVFQKRNINRFFSLPYIKFRDKWTLNIIFTFFRIHYKPYYYLVFVLFCFVVSQLFLRVFRLLNRKSFFLIFCVKCLWKTSWLSIEINISKVRKKIILFDLKVNSKASLLYFEF